MVKFRLLMAHIPRDQPTSYQRANHVRRREYAAANTEPAIVKFLNKFDLLEFD
jgi:hypothetical protein